IRYIIDKFMDYRRESKAKLDSDPGLTIGDVTSVNLTMLHGGIQNNVIPEKLSASFDLRLALSVNFEEFENMKDHYVAPTSVDDTNPYWIAFKAAIEKLSVPLKVRTFPGGTDSRFIRLQGVSALGFFPYRRTVPGLHEHNESLRVSEFINGIAVYEDIIPALANA
ncbi:jg25534, partial [Pararge aegeria aegeria]